MKRIGILALLILSTKNIYAASDPGCRVPTSYQDVVACALVNHPEIVSAANAERRSASFIEVAGQRPNPELAAKGIRGSGSGESTSTTDIDLLHTFELGGKRGARVRQAEAQREASGFDLQRIKAQVAAKTISSLYRLRQLDLERGILDESLETFGRIRSAFKSRPRLSPDQEVSLDVFQLADGDAELKKTVINDQIVELKKGLSIAAGVEIDFNVVKLPPPRDQWPSVSGNGGGETLGNGADMKGALANLRGAEADLAVARSQAWPDLKVGPSWEREAQGNLVTNAFGLGLVFALPLYQTNGAGKAYATIGVENAVRESDLRRVNLQAEREVLVKRYREATAAISKSFNLQSLGKKHRSLEDLFKRGLIPSPLVIESHRQLLDFVKSRNELEITAIEALARIRAIDGAQITENL